MKLVLDTESETFLTFDTSTQHIISHLRFLFTNFFLHPEQWDYPEILKVLIFSIIGNLYSS